MRSSTARWLFLVVAALVIVSGCTGQGGPDGKAQDTIAEQAEPAAARDPETSVNSPDLAGYPMPTQLPGRERAPGPIANRPHDWDLGELGDLLFSSSNDTLVVTVCAMPINCCTERLAAAVTTTAAGVDVMLYEYLPDVCECFHQRDIVFRLCPAPTAGQILRVMANGRQKVLAAQAVP